MSFNARRAKSLEPGEHIIVDHAPGLRLVATATRRTWTYRYKSPVDGAMRQIAMGQWPEMSYPSALAVWEQLKRRRDAGEDLAREKRRAAAVAQARSDVRGRDGIYTVRQLIEDYLQGHVERHRKPKGSAEARRLLVNYTTKIHALQPADVGRSMAFSLLEGVAVKTPVLANSLRSELGAAWDYALDAGRVPEETPNWWRQVLRGKLRSRGKIVDGKHQGVKLRTLQGREVAQLIAHLPRFSAMVADLLTLYLWTGARGAEIIAMTGDEVGQEADGWWWTVPREKQKMARNENLTDLRVPLVGRALDVVRRRRSAYGAGYLFPSRPGSKLMHVEQKLIGVAVWTSRPDVVKRYNYAPERALDMDPWAPHDLRRTVRTQLAALGCQDGVAEAVLGHLPAGIVGTYNRHSYDAERRTWLTKLSEHWEQLAAR